jgi:hypothetical protein
MGARICHEHTYLLPYTATVVVLTDVAIHKHRHVPKINLLHMPCRISDYKVTEDAYCHILCYDILWPDSYLLTCWRNIITSVTTSMELSPSWEAKKYWGTHGTSSTLILCNKMVHFESKGFWCWCTTHRITGFLNAFHCPVFYKI